MTASRIDLQHALFEWFTHELEGFPTVALTLTFKPRVGNFWLTEEIAKGTVHHVRRRINGVSRGASLKTQEAQLRTIAVREGATAKGYKHLHYHLQIEVPIRTAPEEFAMYCRRAWSKLDWGGTQTRAVAGANAGWTSYVLKHRDKPIYDYAIDYENCWLGKPSGDVDGPRHSA